MRVARKTPSASLDNSLWEGDLPTDLKAAKAWERAKEAEWAKYNSDEALAIVERDVAQQEVWPLVRPQDVKDMSLTEVASWIAAKGEKRKFDFNDTSEWNSAYAEVLKKIVNGQIDLLGRRQGGLSAKVPGEVLTGVQIHYPCEDWADCACGYDPYIECMPVGSDPGCGGDCLYSQSMQLEWSNLRIKSDDVIKHWSFAEVSNEDYYPLLPEPPAQKRVAETHRRLAAKYRDGRVPRISLAVLAKSIGSNRDAVARALDLKPLGRFRPKDFRPKVST